VVQFVFEQGADPDPLGAEGEQDKAAGTEREGRVTAAGSEDVLELPPFVEMYTKAAQYKRTYRQVIESMEDTQLVRASATCITKHNSAQTDNRHKDKYSRSH